MISFIVWMAFIEVTPNTFLSPNDLYMFFYLIMLWINFVSFPLLMYFTLISVTVFPFLVTWLFLWESKILCCISVFMVFKKFLNFIKAETVKRQSIVWKKLQKSTSLGRFPVLTESCKIEDNTKDAVLSYDHFNFLTL